MRPELPELSEYVALLEKIWDSRMLSNFAEYSKQLEQIVSDYLDVQARTVVSGDIGLTCAIAALQIPPGSTCLLPSFTFNSTVNAVLWNQLIPVFVDIDPRTLNLDIESAQKMAGLSGPKLVIATHVFGNPADSDSLQALAKKHGAKLLFDAAHGYGSIREGVKVGGLGDVEVFSLSGTKPVTCAEGGLVTSKDEEFLERFEFYRAYGFQGDYNSLYQGMNGKMSELHAALGTLALPMIESALGRRHEQVIRYRRNLSDIEGLEFQAVRQQDRSTFKDLAVILATQEDRQRVEKALSERGVQTKRYFRPCHRMDAFKPYAMSSLPNTEDIYRRILCLPAFASLEDAQIDSICETLRNSLSSVATGGS
ncbi:MAG: DegT/DnrJ/EryC1/StrS family aminotransferase [Planctomycetota bacterium]